MPLTSQALSSFARLTKGDDDEDENLPLSSIVRKRGAMSDIGLGMPSRTGHAPSLQSSSAGRPPLAVIPASSASAVGVRTSAVDSNAPTRFSNNPRRISPGQGSQHQQQRSLSTFSTTASQISPSPDWQPRSSSAQGTSSPASLRSSIGQGTARGHKATPSVPGVTLSDLIAAEMAKDGLTATPSLAGTGPSTVSDSSLPVTPPNEGVHMQNKITTSSVNSSSRMPLRATQHKSSFSDAGLLSSRSASFGTHQSSSVQTTSVHGNSAGHGRTASLPLNKISPPLDASAGGMYERMRNRHRQEALTMPSNNPPNRPASTRTPSGAHAAFDSFVEGVPPGVDPILYASCKFPTNASSPVYTTALRTHRNGADCGILCTCSRSATGSKACLATTVSTDDGDDAQLCPPGCSAIASAFPDELAYFVLHADAWYTIFSGPHDDCGTNRSWTPAGLEQLLCRCRTPQSEQRPFTRRRTCAVTSRRAAVASPWLQRRRDRTQAEDWVSGSAAVVLHLRRLRLLRQLRLPCEHLGSQ